MITQQFLIRDVILKLSALGGDNYCLVMGSVFMRGEYCSGKIVDEFVVVLLCHIIK